MKVKTTIEFKKHYIYVRRFQNAKLDEIEDIWRQITAACEQHNCYNILVESFTGNIPVKDRFSSREVYDKAGINHHHRIAWVHHQKESLRDMETIESAIKKLGFINGKLFPNIEKALEWLLKKND